MKIKLCRMISIIIFFIFQLPLWKISFNKNGNKFQCKGRLYNCKVYISGYNNELIIAERVLLFNTNITIVGNNNKVVIEEGSIVYEKGRIRVEDEDNMVRLGKGVRIIDAFVSSADKGTIIDIDDHTLVSANVVIRSSDSHSIVDSQGQRINNGESVYIGKNVWLGNGVTILKGSRIGDKSVVGTQSLITGKCFPNNSLIVGNPGRVVMDGISWNDKRI